MAMADSIKSSKDKILFIGVLATAIACIAIPCWQLLVPGPFEWHIAQPQFWQGGIEALALACLVAATQLLNHRNLRLALTLVCAELYLRRHAVDAAMLVDLVYFELCIGLGAYVMRIASGRIPQDIPGYLSSFVIGLCTWSTCAWTLSAVGLGSLHDLRWMTLLLLIPALAARSRPWTVYVHARVDAMPTMGRICASIVFTWFLVQVARSAVAIDFDSLWYGLRGQYVLVDSSSAFASLGLVSPVYYFPKFYELFLIPLSGLGSSSVITGITLFTGTLLAAAGYEILKRLGVRGDAIRFVGILACISVPAIGNQMLQTKGDILAALLLTFAWIKAAEFVATRTRTSLIWLLGLLLLATQARLSAIPFAAAISVATLLAFLLQRATRRPDDRQELRLAWVSLCLATIVSGFVSARTLLLAGMPTIGPDPLFKLWQALGFHLKFPAGTLHWSYPKNWDDIFPLLTDFLFRPQNLPHIEITWVGNIWAWLAAVGMLAMLLARKRPALPDDLVRPGLGLVLASIVLMLCWGYQIRGGDGNYFIAGLLPATLLAFASAWRSLNPFPIARGAFVVCVSAFCFFQTGYGFMSAAWTTGTRPFDLVFDRSIREFRDRERKVLVYFGIGHIADYLRTQHGPVHVVGYVDHESDFALPATFEGLADISYARHELVEDRAKFLKFLAETKVKYLIMPNARHQSTTDATKHISPMILKLTSELATVPSLRSVTDASYDMYDVSQLKEALAKPKSQSASLRH